MSLARSKKKASEREAQKAAAKPETKVLKGAFIIPAEDGVEYFKILSELPIKYSELVKPMLDGFQNAVRGDINVTTAPPPPPPPPGAQASPVLKAEKPEPKAKAEK